MAKISHHSWLIFATSTGKIKMLSRIFIYYRSLEKLCSVALKLLKQYPMIR